MITNFSSLSVSIQRAALAAGFLLLIPFIAMQFSSQVNWGLGDFIIAGVLLFGIGLGVELMFGKLRGNNRRTIIGAVLALAMLVIWAELAVGIFN